MLLAVNSTLALMDCGPTAEELAPDTDLVVAGQVLSVKNLTNLEGVMPTAAQCAQLNADLPPDLAAPCGGSSGLQVWEMEIEAKEYLLGQGPAVLSFRFLDNAVRIVIGSQCPDLAIGSNVTAFLAKTENQLWTTTLSDESVTNYSRAYTLAALLTRGLELNLSIPEEVYYPGAQVAVTHYIKNSGDQSVSACITTGSTAYLRSTGETKSWGYFKRSHVKYPSKCKKRFRLSPGEELEWIHAQKLPERSTSGAAALSAELDLKVFTGGTTGFSHLDSSTVAITVQTPKESLALP